MTFTCAAPSKETRVVDVCVWGGGKKRGQKKTRRWLKSDLRAVKVLMRN